MDFILDKITDWIKDLLVSGIMEEYHKTLKNGEKPIIHSDRGAYYR